MRQVKSGLTIRVRSCLTGLSADEGLFIICMLWVTSSTYGQMHPSELIDATITPHLSFFIFVEICYVEDMSYLPSRPLRDRRCLHPHR